MTSYDRLEDDYKDLDRSIHLEDISEDDTCFMIHGNILPTPRLIKALKKLKDGEFISANGNKFSGWQNSSVNMILTGIW